MSERLTDERVAALTDCAWGWGHESIEDNDTNEVTPADVEDLALEVQQSRARRCGDCKWWERIYKHGHMGRCSAWSMTTESSHFCADFSKSEEPR